MMKKLLEVLARHVSAAELEKLKSAAQQLDDLSQQLVAVLSTLPASARRDLVEQFETEVLAALKNMDAAALPGDPQGNSDIADGNAPGLVRTSPSPPTSESDDQPQHPTPERLEWARLSREYLTADILELVEQEFDAEEGVAGDREGLETGFLPLEDFIKELEELAALRE
jgi:hypothetical protein